MKRTALTFLIVLSGLAQAEAEISNTTARQKLEEYGELLLNGNSAVELMGLGENGEACSISISKYKGEMSLIYLFREKGFTYADSMFNPHYAIIEENSSVSESEPVLAQSDVLLRSASVSSSIDDSRATLNINLLQNASPGADTFLGGSVEFKRSERIRKCQLSLRVIDKRDGPRRSLLQSSEIK